MSPPRRKCTLCEYPADPRFYLQTGSGYFALCDGCAPNTSLRVTDPSDVAAICFRVAEPEVHIRPRFGYSTKLRRYPDVLDRLYLGFSYEGDLARLEECETQLAKYYGLPEDMACIHVRGFLLRKALHGSLCATNLAEYWRLMYAVHVAWLTESDEYSNSAHAP